MVHLNIGAGQQFLDYVDMTALRRRDQRRAAKAIGQFGVGAGINGQFENLKQSFRASVQKGIVQPVVLNMNIRPGCDQRTHRCHLVAMRRRHDRGASPLVATVDSRASSQQL